MADCPVFTPREYDVPLFVSAKFPTPDGRCRRPELRRLLRTYQHFYPGLQRPAKCAPPPTPPPRRGWTCCPRFAGDRSQSLPPNRYRLDSHTLAYHIRHNRCGLRGPYDLFTGPRDRTNMQGHLAPSKDPGSLHMWYDCPAGGQLMPLSHPRQAFRGRIRDSNRDYLESKDRLAWLERSNRRPGPTAYCPQNYAAIRTDDAVRLHALRTQHVVTGREFFPPGTCVPINDRFWRPDGDAVFRPGVGRYELSDAARCSGRCCRIAGNGHRWVFVSAVQRLLRRPRRTRKAPKTLKTAPTLQLDTAYVERMRNPHRVPLSGAVENIPTKERTMVFNTIKRPTKKNKLRKNRKVAFGSGRARWPQARQEDWKPVKRLADAERPPAPVKPIPIYATRTVAQSERTRMTARERLVLMAPRLERLRVPIDQSNKVRMTFAPLPEARILIDDPLAVDEERLELVNTEVNLVALYSEDVLAKMADWEVRKKLLGL